MSLSRSKALGAVLLVVRFVLGAVLIYAAWVKLRESWLLFALSIDNYQILPQWAVEVVARTLPWGELALGLLLIVGRWRRVSTAAASALLGVFFSLMVRAWLRGQKIDCGCFGPGEAISPLTLLRDGSLLVGALLLTAHSFWRKRAGRQPAEASSDSVVAGSSHFVTGD